MPYIPQHDRDHSSVDFRIDTVGELNWTITRMCHNFIRNMGISYRTLNEVIGVLECAKQELYRQVVAPYEDDKKALNGSVSILDGGLPGPPPDTFEDEMD